MYRYSQQPVTAKRKGKRAHGKRRYASAIETKRPRTKFPVRLKKVIVVVCIVAILFLVLHFATFFGSLYSLVSDLRGGSIMDQGRTTLVFDTGHLTVVSFNNATHSIAIFTLPSTIYTQTQTNKQEKLAATYGIAELNKPGSGGIALEKAAQNTLGIFIDGYIHADGLPDTTFSPQQFQKHFGSWTFPLAMLDGAGIVGKSQTSLTKTDYLKFWWAVKNTRFDRITTVDLSQTNAVQAVTLADGSQVLGISDTAVDAVIGDATQDTMISQEGARVVVINASGVAGRGEQLARELTNLGAHVIQVTGTDEIKPTSTIAVSNKDAAKELLKRLSKMSKFTIISAQKGDSQLGDVVITIGAQ